MIGTARIHELVVWNENGVGVGVGHDSHQKGNRHIFTYPFDNSWCSYWNFLQKYITS